MRATLIFPRTQYVSGDPPLGLAYIAAYARKEIKDLDIQIIDLTFHRSIERTKKELKEFKPDIVGIFVDTLMYMNAVDIAKCAKGMGVYVVMGGPHATVAPESLLEHCDIVVKGEGEEAFCAIVKKVAAGSREKQNERIFSMPRHNIINLDHIPFPAFDLLDMKSYQNAWNYLDSVELDLKGTTMITSRGCPYKCSYCQPTLDELFGPKLRRRSPQNVIDEMIDLKEKYAIDGIFFHDDTFTIDRKWILAFCDLMKKQNVDLLWGCNSRINTADEEILDTMQKAGLRNIHYGIESGSQRIIDEIYQKKINLKDVDRVIAMTKKMGIHAFAFFMIGAPTETPQEIKMTINLARRLPLDEASFSITTPLLGTFLYDKTKNMPGYEVSQDFRDFDYYRKTAVKKGGIPMSKLRYWQMRALLSFYLSPMRLKYILQHLWSIRGMRQLVRKIRRFI